VLEIDKRAAIPQLLVKFVPAHNPARLPHQSEENLLWLPVKPETNAVLA
jgi:hypothetical protein